MHWVTRACVVTVLGSSAQALAQAPEPPARKAAAIADYLKSCASQINSHGGSDNIHGFLPMRPYGQPLPQWVHQIASSNLRGSTFGALEACGATVAIRHASSGVPGYDRGAGLARPSPRPARPRIAAQPAPAGPLKTTISAQQARDNAVDAALRREIDALIARFKVTGVCTWRTGAIQDPCVKNNAQKNILLTDAVLASLEAQRGKVSENYYRSVKTPWENVRARIVADCAKLASSTTACGLPAPDSAYGKKSRIIARDGRHAMACVKLVTISKGDSSTTGLGNRVLSNQCNGPVQIGWCYVGGECERGAGNSWTIGPQRSWPVSAVKEIRWGACHGANTIHGDPGSKGLQFTCSKPAK